MKRKNLYGITALVLLISAFHVSAEDIIIEDGSFMETVQDQEMTTEEIQDWYSNTAIDFVDDENFLADEDVFTEETGNTVTYDEMPEDEISYNEEGLVLEENIDDNDLPEELQKEELLQNSTEEELLDGDMEELDVSAADILGTSETASVQSSTTTILAKSGLLDRQKPTLEQIRSRYLAIPTYKLEYDVVPGTAAPYWIGRVNRLCLLAGIDTFNLYRYVAGLNDVALSGDLTDSAQYGALINAANNVLTHTPDRPAGMDDATYRAGCIAAGSSNILANVNSMERSVMDYVSDFGNLELENRRRMFNPLMQNTGLGMAISQNGSKFYALETSDETGVFGDFDFISWPASGITPNCMLTNNTLWSVGINPTKYHVNSLNDITVTVEHEGKKWVLNSSNQNGSWENPYLSYSAPGFGPLPYIIFHPGIGNIGQDLMRGIYTVTVNGVKSNSADQDVEIKYDINFVDLVKYVDKLEISPADGRLDVPIGSTVKMQYKYYPADAEVNKVEWVSSETTEAFPDGTFKLNKNETEFGFMNAVIRQMYYEAWGDACVNLYQPVTEITVDVRDYIDMTPGQIKHVTATYAPSNAKFTELVWHSENEEVVKVAQDGTLTAGSPGSATITVASVYDRVAKTIFVTVRTDINNATIDIQKEVKFTGDPIKKFPTITYNGRKLVKNEDYTLEFSDNVYPGTAKVTITGICYFKGTVTKTYTIVRRSVEKAYIGGIGKNRRWTGEPITHNVKVKINKKWLTAGKDYTVSYKNNVNVGTGTIIITGIGNYTGTAMRTFKINPVGIEISKLKISADKITVSYPKQLNQTRGYQVQICTDKTFKNGWRVTYTTTNRYKSWKTFTNLEQGTVYYFRVRTYSNVNGVKYYSKWSTVMSGTPS